VPGATTRNAALVIAIAVAMAALFAVSYSLALGRPTPHHVPAALVVEPGARTALVAALQRETDGGLRLSPYPTARAAQRAIGRQRVYAALVLERGRARLLVASAAGTSVARLLGQVGPRAAARIGERLDVVDVRPLPAQDPQGLVAFYVTLAATILGFVTTFQLRANARDLSLRGWLGSVAALAVVGGLVLSVVTHPLIGAFRTGFLETWAALSAQTAVAALFNLTMLTLVGRWAIIPTWGVFVLIGNAASGGAVAPPLLPAFYEFAGRFLPTGATVEAIRNAVYFNGAQQSEPALVVALWLVGTLVALLAVARVRGHTPGTST
jgi:hypothetical protein